MLVACRTHHRFFPEEIIQELIIGKRSKKTRKNSKNARCTRCDELIQKAAKEQTNADP